jgi:integrase
MADETPNTSGPRVLLSVEEAAATMNVGRTTVYALIKTGELESVKVGRRRLVPADAVAQCITQLAERGSEPQAEPTERRVAEAAPRAPRKAKESPFLESVSATNELGTDEQDASAPKPRASKSPRRPKRPDGTRAPNGESSVYFSEADGYWHGWVTMGIRDNGRPDRRHRMNKDEKTLRKAVRDLENKRDAGTDVQVGPAWTVEKWLRHWVEHISAPTIRRSSADAYRNAVYNHLIPGLGAHRLDKVRPEHFERLYAKMQQADHKPGNIHQVHRTAKTAFNEAERRGYVSKNVVKLAKSPRLVETEIEPYSVEEVRRILDQASQTRHAARWAIALVLGLRQGEVLGLRWKNVDLDQENLMVHRNRLRPKYEHGCTKPCGKKAGFCPNRVKTNEDIGEVKSRAGQRPMGLPGPIVQLLRDQKAAQDKEREAAGTLWTEGDYVFTTLTGRPISTRVDYDDWKDLLRKAGVRDGRLHDARHTAATLLLELGVPDRTTQSVMGWSDGSMAKRYQHVVKRIRDDVAKRQTGLVWETPPAPEDAPNEPSTDPTATETATDGPDESSD